MCGSLLFEKEKLKLNINRVTYLLLSLSLLAISCKKKPQKVLPKEVDITLKEYYDAKKIVFNNEERSKQGIPAIDSLPFTKELFEEKRITFENDRIDLKKIFKVEFNREDNLVLDSYYIGKDSILRIQTKVEEGKYQDQLFALLFYGEYGARFLTLEELEELNSKKGLFSKKDTLFYGQKLVNGRFEVNLKEDLYDGYPTQKIDY